MSASWHFWGAIFGSLLCLCCIDTTLRLSQWKRKLQCNTFIHVVSCKHSMIGPTLHGPIVHIIVPNIRLRWRTYQADTKQIDINTWRTDQLLTANAFSRTLFAIWRRGIGIITAMHRDQSSYATSQWGTLLYITASLIDWSHSYVDTRMRTTLHLSFKCFVDV